jgi:hypothetical protein
MLMTLVLLFFASLAGLTIVGWLSDKQAPQNKNITPGLNLLPGDVKWENQSGNVKVYFPITTSIVVSVVVSLLFWLFGR